MNEPKEKLIQSFGECVMLLPMYEAMMKMKLVETII